MWIQQLISVFVDESVFGVILMLFPALNMANHFFQDWCDMKSETISKHRLPHFSEKTSGWKTIQAILKKVVASHYKDPDRLLARAECFGLKKATCKIAIEQTGTMKTVQTFTFLSACFLLILITGCKPRLDSSDPAERLRAVEASELTNQNVLLSVALNDAAIGVRSAAAGKLTDQVILAKVALEAKDSDVRWIASKNLTNQALLAEVTLDSRDWRVRENAIEMLTNQAVLAKVATDGEQDIVREAAVRRLTNQSLLAKLATAETEEEDSFPFPSVSFANFTNQDLLAKVAVEAKNSNIRRFAIVKLTDQDLLAKVALKVRNSDIRRFAIATFTNQPLLARLALEDKDTSVRQAAFFNLTDQGILAGIALDQAQDSTVRKNSVAKLTDQGLLARVALEATDSDSHLDSNVGWLAVYYLTNQAFLTKVALEANYSTTAWYAGYKLTDPDTLAKVAFKAKDLGAREAALDNITNQAVLAKIAVNDNDLQLRKTAVENLTDQVVLAKLAIADKDYDIRLAAVENLTDKTVLARVADQDKNNSIGQCAVGNLNDQALLAKVGVHAQDQAALVGVAVENPSSDVRLAAVRRIADSESLKFVLLGSTDRNVSKIALSKLNNRVLLMGIAGYSGNVDQAVRIATAHKAGIRTWDDIFSAAAINSKSLSDAFAALQLFENLTREETDINKAVEKACLTLIRRGDLSRIPEMVGILQDYGNKSLAEDFINCGQPDLQRSAKVWASSRGYEIEVGPGSARARWGSDEEDHDEAMSEH